MDDVDVNFPSLPDSIAMAMDSTETLDLENTTHQTGRSSPNEAGGEFDDDFMSTRSVFSKTTFYTAPPGTTAEFSNTIHYRLERDNAYAQLLESKKLWPVDSLVEQDWSGRGQHAEFRKDERKIVNEILDVHDTLGSTRNAVVQSVKCRRILLARKTISCSKSFTKDQATEEVAHLTRLNHAHVVRVIGTYVMGRELSILIYPVAKYNLKTFLDIINKQTYFTKSKLLLTIISMKQFLSCLSSAIHHIHSNGIKHMDIKPTNILISNDDQVGKFKIYIADFGIARAYCDPSDAETDGPTSFTKKYASPEVYSYQETGLTRGFPADIFSLGCVFIEIVCTMHDNHVHEFNHCKTMQEISEIIDRDGSGSYQAKSDDVLDILQKGHSSCENTYRSSSNIGPMDNIETISRMIRKDPQDRPTAAELVQIFQERYCCRQGCHELEVMSLDTFRQQSPDFFDEEIDSVVSSSVSKHLYDDDEIGLIHNNFLL